MNRRTGGRAGTSYADLLKDPRWQKKRLLVLEAAGWECSSCGANDKTLHVHHLRYVRGRMPWEYPNDELEVLCEGCHEEATFWTKRLDALVEEVKLAGRIDVEHAAGYLAALVASSDRAVASSENAIAVTGPEEAAGIGNYVFGPITSDTMIFDRIVDGKVDVYALRLEFVRAYSDRRKGEEE